MWAFNMSHEQSSLIDWLLGSCATWWDYELTHNEQETYQYFMGKQQGIFSGSHGLKFGRTSLTDVPGNRFGSKVQLDSIMFYMLATFRTRSVWWWTMNPRSWSDVPICPNQTCCIFFPWIWLWDPWFPVKSSRKNLLNTPLMVKSSVLALLD